MNRTLGTLLLAMIVAATVPLAAADETKAECEDRVQWVGKDGAQHDGPQPWIGYGSTDPFRELWYDIVDQDRVLNTCEGEHWDGQDNVQPGQNPGTDASCTKGQTLIDTTGRNLFVGSCMPPNPNTGAADPFAGNGQALTFRVSFAQRNGAQELYVAVNIALVGRAATYVGNCAEGGRGLEGQSSCEGGGQQRAATYLRDDTPNNVLAGVVSATGATKGYPAESDCDQSTYEKGAYESNKDPAQGACGRDNTAITVETLLP